MTLTLADKKAIVAEVSEVAKNAISVVAADYRGLTVDSMTELRQEARKRGVYLRVVRNTLSKRAFEGTDYACLNDVLVGPLFLAFSTDAPGTAARLLRDFAKKNDKLEVKALAVGDALYGAESLEAVASLPTRDEALSQLLSVMKEPIAKFVRTLSAPNVKLVRTLVAIQDKKQAG